MNIQENISLKILNSWKVGGAADFYAAPTTIEELIEAETWAKDNGHPITILGGGTNALISDKGIRGLCINLRKLKGSEMEEKDGKLFVTALSGTTKMELLKVFLKYQLPPAMMFAGIPGDIGGGVVMNAGIGEKIEPREFHEITQWVEVLSEGNIKRFGNRDIDWSYRNSHGWQPGIITKVCVAWPLDHADPNIKEKVKQANKIRLTKQPLHLPSCGSVFVNPKPLHSGALIEDCGLKGFSIGGAQVSEKHANFIVNTGESTADDIHQVVEHVKKTVFEKKAVKLDIEFTYLGDW
ncbi:MAG: UDP-N-acetylmuramate dehydrogenase [Bdellovibrionales bacterium]